MKEPQSRFFDTGTLPLPATVTIGILRFLIEDPYKPSLLGGGNTQIIHNINIPTSSKRYGLKPKKTWWSWYLFSSIPLVLQKNTVALDTEG